MRYGPPIDLSDLENLNRAASRPRLPAFVGRVSTKDNQNPATSIPRQVDLASESLEPGEKFAAYFWDVESGMLPPELRGLGPQEMYDALGVPVRRDGGMQDLVDRAADLGITHVLAERSDRLARAMLTSLTVEHGLKRIGVEVVYANEPVGGTESGRLRTRRYSQVEAELYRTNLMEMSVGGQIHHAVQGWNHGHPPYPYIAVVDENAPQPRQARYGMTRPKKKLVPHPDPRRFPAAAELCRLRREEHLPTGTIVKILAADPERFPAEGRWTYNLVDGLISNPKLTGHQVYNRKATRTGQPGASRLNPMSLWVWSPAATHEAVVSLQEWKEAQKVTEAMRLASKKEGPLLLIRAAAARLGFTVTAVHSNGTHTVYRIGTRELVLPDPVPDVIVQQVIADMEASV